MEEKLINEIMMYYGTDFDSEMSNPLRICVRRAISSFQNKRNYPDYYTESVINKDMTKFYACLFDLSLYWMNKMGVEFQSSHIENNVDMRFVDEKDIYATHNVIPLGRII